MANSPGFPTGAAKEPLADQISYGLDALPVTQQAESKHCS